MGVAAKINLLVTSPMDVVISWEGTCIALLFQLFLNKLQHTKSAIASLKRAYNKKIAHLLFRDEANVSPILVTSCDCK